MYSCTEIFYLISGTFVFLFFILYWNISLYFRDTSLSVRLFLYRNILLYFRDISLSFLYSCTGIFRCIFGALRFRFFIRVPENFVVFPGHFSYVSLFVYRKISLYFRDTSLSFLYSCTGIFRSISGTVRFLFYSCTGIFRCISGTLRFLFIYSCSGIFRCISWTLRFLFFYSCTRIFHFQLFILVPEHVAVIFVPPST